MRKLILGAVVALTLMFAGRAQAGGFGYPCWLEYQMGFPGNYYGAAGSLAVGLYSGANCTGTYQGASYFTTAGNSAGCSRPYSESAILALMQTLRQSMYYKIWISGDQCANAIDFYLN